MKRQRAAAALAHEAVPVSVAAAAFTLAVGLPSGDPDMWWNLASGRWMVEHRDILRVDIFSSTATGLPYALGQTLGEVVLYAAYALGGWAGIALLRASIVALAAFAVARSTLRSAPPLVALPVVAIVLVLSKPVWTDRPQLFTLALFPLLLELALAARTGSRAALVATVPLLFVWSDLHAGYALGLAVLWIFALDALVFAGGPAGRPSTPVFAGGPAGPPATPRVLDRRHAGAFLVAALVGTASVSLNPGALPLLRAADHVATAARAIVEESPPDVLTPFGALFALVVAALLVAFLRNGAEPLAALLLVPMLWLALSAQRHVPLFGFAAAPFLARAIWREAAAASRRREADRVGVAGRRLRRPPLHQARTSSAIPGPPFDPQASTVRRRPPSEAVIAIALWIGAIASIAVADPRPDLRAYPEGALAALRGSRGILLNEYDWGGYLIWAVPERPVFIDGRLFPFVADVLGEYRDTLALRPRWRAVLDRHGVSQVLVRPDRPLAGALREDGWIVRSEADAYVLLERPR